MTAIAALLDSGKAYIGADSAGVADYNLVLRADEKVFENGEYIFGCCGSFRVAQILRYGFRPPTPKPGENDLRGFMATRFIDAIRIALKKAGAAERKDNLEAIDGSSFIVGFRSQLFVIESDFQVGQPIDGYCAVGCGANQALGSLFSTDRWRRVILPSAKEMPVTPEWRIQSALAAAERFSAGVRGPFHVRVKEWAPRRRRRTA